MKLRDRAHPQGVIDTWMRSVEAEFGGGGHVGTLLRLNPTVRRLLESPAQTDQLVEFGYVLGMDNRELEFAMRSLQLLGDAAGPSVAAALQTRATAVHVADGWN